MIASLNNTYDVSQIIVATVIILGFLGGVVGLIDRRFRKYLNGRFQDVLDEVKPNGGNTKTNGDITLRTEQTITAHVEDDAKVQAAQRKELRAMRRELREMRRLVETQFGTPTIGELATEAEGRRRK